MSQNVLEIKDIVKTYMDGEEERLILDGAGITLKEDEFAAIVGPSGCGKSTFLTIAGMLLSSDGGSIKIRGKVISDRKKKEWTKIRQEHIGFVFQDHQLLPYLKGREQISAFQNRKSCDIDLSSMISDLGLEDVLDHYPNKMSGGEKQRVAILRAFANNPDVILADEPTASLDEERSDKVVSLIRKEIKRYHKAALMVTHDERVLKYVDTVYRMDHGKLIKEDKKL